ncbi:DUF3857 domain-containing transglutaminase family protein [Arsukibacterium indicum]|uniref:DUF3857 domain-containing transglutaminase family protein n=1 Tax=Arsukibacterium indicum TaxID=2848612 RepID=A0ABS6MQ90_9GAMM|nr:DUF3857 domain-containing transglutaminase family protein [Arsukibacterium indicum]MBV2130900.1 DUF3857 domain-containing transglutaminase family protein [Arsukibacterium indicum]
MTQLSRILALLSLMIAMHSAAQVAQSPIPEWVVSLQPALNSKVPEQDISNGTYYLLADTQLWVPATGQQQIFEHYASLVTSSKGLEKAGQLSIYYDPTYQQVALHQLNIIRAGSTINRYPQARITLVQTEQDLDKLLYHGETALNIVIPDVRVGDIIEYSYSLSGSNPVFADRFNTSQRLNWTVPLQQQHWRLMWQRAEPLAYKFSKEAVPLEISSENGTTTYSFVQHNVPPVKHEDDTPDWYSPYNSLSMSNSPQWQDIARWGVALFEPAIDDSPAVTAQVARLQRDYLTPELQIAAALKFVQTEIRYLGIELGESSHKPASAAKVLQQRYGDCKDKSVLLVSILRQLGHKALPVLVNTELKTTITERLPSAGVFDHAIVKLDFNGKSYWLDPTRSFQAGPLERLYQPDYGYALELSAASTGLTAMHSATEYTEVLINEQFHLPDVLTEPAEYRVSTLYSGLDAERSRSQFASNSVSQKADGYVQFYSRYYPNITLAEPISKTDDAVSGSVAVNEFYRITDFWQADATEPGKLDANFYSNGISSYLQKPEIAANRTQPFVLSHPVNISQTITVELNNIDWQFDDEQVVEHNPFFHYQSQLQFDNSSKVLTLRYQYKSLTDHIMPEQRADYIAAVDRARSDLNLNIYQRDAVNEVVATSADGSSKVMFLLVAVYLMLCILCAALWLLPVGTYRHNQRFGEPMFRFILTWLVTFSLYGMYWCIKNNSHLNAARLTEPPSAAAAD